MNLVVSIRLSSMETRPTDCRGNPCGCPDLCLLLDAIVFEQAQDLTLLNVREHNV